MSKFIKRTKLSPRDATLRWKRPRPGLALSLFILSALSVPGAIAGAPTAAQILDRYVKVTGGQAAWHTKKSQRLTIEGRALESNEVVLRATILLTRSGNSINEIEAPEAASEGICNGVAWAWTSLSGARIKHGPDRATAMRAARMLEEADWRTLYSRSRVEASETVAGRRAWKVALLPSEDEKTEWFDAETGLLLRRSFVENSSSGPAVSDFIIEGWSTRDGVSQPNALLASRGEFSYRLRVLAVSYNDAHGAVCYPEQVAEYLAREREGKALPNAEELIERHIFESGGTLAYEGLKTQKITGTLDFLSRNIVAKTEALSAGNGRYFQSLDIPGMGRQEQGSDGHTTWERSPVLGPRAKPRRSLDGLGITIEAAEVTGWRYLVSQVRTEAEEELDGHDCYRVRLTGRDGRDAGLRWYDRETGLLYRARASLNSDMGPVPAVLTYEEYREVAGLKWPVRIHMDVSGQALVFQADEVVLNGRIDETVFDLPDEVKSLNGIAAQ